MEKCFFRKTSLVNNHLTACLPIFLGITGVFLSVFLFGYSVITTADLIANIILLSLAITILILGAYCYFVTSCSYSISTSGITLFYFFNQVQVSYSWEEISSILVCDIDHSNRCADLYRVVIRICVGTDPCDPHCKKDTFLSMLSGREYWRDGSSMYRYPTKLILLDYSPERVLSIEEVAGKKAMFALTPPAAEKYGNAAPKRGSSSS